MSNQSADQLCWFDELFNGGILIPRASGKEKRAITLLITGPPGTGKSTLAMELCVRLALNPEANILGGKTLYIASEAHPPWMIDNVLSFGWMKGRSRDSMFDLGDSPKEAPISIRTLSDIEAYEGSRESIIGDLQEMFGLRSAHDAFRASAPDFGPLGLVVIDSLNTVKSEKAAEFEKFHNRFVKQGPRLILFILDSSPNRPVAETWEFASDIVLRLDKEYRSGYMIRTIEVEKARYQLHVWGKHQLKIYEAQGMEQRPAAVPSATIQEQRLRAHPYRLEGGIFVFPSIHYILSRYKREAPPSGEEKTLTVPTPLPSLNRLLGSGIPAGRTTALLGDRGAHKSHIGYLQALQNVLTSSGKSLIISLRDDEEMTLRTLRGILPQQWPNNHTTINDFLRDGSLEVTYYMPGYITPEEFFHRLLLSIYRMRKDDPKCPITLLFNSLDQIASRFPLCAEERVFIPGIIQTLAAIGVTSVFVGADTEGVDDGLRNLLSMAELIIRVKRRPFSKKRFLVFLPHASENSVRRGGKEEAEKLPNRFLSTELTVERYAGGKAAGSQGLLEFVTKDSVLCGVLSAGLQFIPYLTMPTVKDDRGNSRHSQ